MTSAVLGNINDLFNPLANNRNLNRAMGDAFLNIVISRDNILEDTLNALVSEKVVDNLNKPLRVVFKNEPAIDEGGVQKEFF